MPAAVGIRIEVGGRERPDLVRGVEVSVEQDLFKADVASLSWAGRPELVDDPDLDPEQRRPLRVALAYGQGVPVPTTLFDGTVAKLGAEFAEDVRVRVQAYDHSLSLRQNVEPRSWANVTLAEVVTDVAKAHGLEVEFEAEGPFDAERVRFGYVAKKDETDWQFLLRHALLRGFEVFIRPGRLIWRPRRTMAEPSRRWDYRGQRKNLRQFSPQWSTLRAKRETIVMAWDPASKLVLVGQSRDLVQYGARHMLIREKPQDPADADRIAQAARQEEELEAVTATAEPTEPDAGLVPGLLVDVSGVGKRFGGVYFVVGASHRISGSGYRQQARLQTAVALGEAIRERGPSVNTQATPAAP